MTMKFFNHKNGQIAYDVTGEGQLVVVDLDIDDFLQVFVFDGLYQQAAGHVVGNNGGARVTTSANSRARIK